MSPFTCEGEYVGTLRVGQCAAFSANKQLHDARLFLEDNWVPLAVIGRDTADDHVLFRGDAPAQHVRASEQRKQARDIGAAPLRDRYLKWTHRSSPCARAQSRMKPYLP